MRILNFWSVIALTIGVVTIVVIDRDEWKAKQERIRSQAAAALDQCVAEAFQKGEQPRYRCANEIDAFNLNCVKEQSICASDMKKRISSQEEMLRQRAEELKKVKAIESALGELANKGISSSDLKDYFREEIMEEERQMKEYEDEQMREYHEQERFDR